MPNVHCPERGEVLQPLHSMTSPCGNCKDTGHNEGSVNRGPSKMLPGSFLVILGCVPVSGCQNSNLESLSTL